MRIGVEPILHDVKAAYILAGEYRCEEMMVASTVSMTTLASIISLVIWL